MIRWLMVALLIVPAAAKANDAFPFGDATTGEKLFAQKCAECHVRKFGDVASSFTRADRKAKEAASILSWVQRCNNALKSGLGREEEEHLSAYLNDAFYRYK